MPAGAVLATLLGVLGLLDIALFDSLLLFDPILNADLPSLGGIAVGTLVSLCLLLAIREQPWAIAGSSWVAAHADLARPTRAAHRPQQALRGHSVLALRL